MEIIDKCMHKQVRFETICQGKAFVYNDLLVMKVEPFITDDGDGINAVYLGSGETTWIEDDEIVLTIKDCSITYE